MIKIICVGKLKEKYLKEGIEEYSKRLSKFTKLEIIELSDESLNEESDSLINKSIEIESKRILDKISPKDYVILCAIKGNMLTSEELATTITNINNDGNSTIIFVIGGSYGVSKNVYDRANYKLSFSKFTLPHQLFRLVLLEQIYRSFKIINNERYHK